MIIGLIFGTWPASVLPYVGAVLLFAGSARGALDALGFPHPIEFLRGGADRLRAVTEECQRQLAKVEYLVVRVSRSRADVHEVITAATATVCASWARGAAGPAFRFFLYCNAVLGLRIRSDADKGTAWGEDVENEAILTLHRVCRVPVPMIARMLDSDENLVRFTLSTASPDPRAGTE